MSKSQTINCILFNGLAASRLASTAAALPTYVAFLAPIMRRRITEVLHRRPIPAQADFERHSSQPAPSYERPARLTARGLNWVRRVICISPSRLIESVLDYSGSASGDVAEIGWQNVCAGCA